MHHMCWQDFVQCGRDREFGFPNQLGRCMMVAYLPRLWGNGVNGFYRTIQCRISCPAGLASPELFYVLVWGSQILLLFALLLMGCLIWGGWDVTLVSPECRLMGYCSADTSGGASDLCWWSLLISVGGMGLFIWDFFHCDRLSYIPFFGTLLNCWATAPS